MAGRHHTKGSAAWGPGGVQRGIRQQERAQKQQQKAQEKRSRSKAQKLWDKVKSAKREKEKTEEWANEQLVKLRAEMKAIEGHNTEISRLAAGQAREITRLKGQLADMTKERDWAWEVLHHPDKYHGPPSDD